MSDTVTEETPLLFDKTSATTSINKDDHSGLHQIQTQDGGVSQKDPTTTLAPDDNDDDNKSDDSSEQEFSIRRLTGRSKYTLVFMALAQFFAGCGFSLLAPFFPQEAKLKGVSTSVTGFIFSSFELCIFISSPFYGYYISKIGPKFMFNTGILAGSVTSILFGVLQYCPPGKIFIVMCFLCRCTEALGASAFITAGFAIISYEFPKNVATVFGIMETASGIGMMVGPAIGGALYELGGFGLPFYVIGGLIFMNGLLIFKCLPETRSVKKERKGNVWALLRSPMVLITLLTIIVASVGITFMDPVLASHLDQFHLSSSIVGLVFVVGPGIYGFTSPLWGYLSDKKDIQAPLIVLGNIVIGIGYMFIGPSPLFPFLPTDQLWVIIVGLVMLGLTFGCAVVPTMKSLVIGAMDLGFEDNIDTFGIVSGLFNSLFSLGGFMGPTLGGVLIDNVGFYWGFTIISGCSFFVALVTTIYHVGRRLSRSRRGASQESTYISPHEDVEQVIPSPENSVKMSQSYSTSEKKPQSATDIPTRRKSLLRSLSSPGQYVQ